MYNCHHGCRILRIFPRPDGWYNSTPTPAGYVRGLAAGLSPHVYIHEHSPVISLKRIGGVWRKQVPKGQATAPKVTFATNRHLKIFGFTKGRLIHVFLCACMTPELPGGINGATLGHHTVRSDGHHDATDRQAAGRQPHRHAPLCDGAIRYADQRPGF